MMLSLNSCDVGYVLILGEDWLVEQSCSRVEYCYVRVEG